jgi:hypothetical protein
MFICTEFQQAMIVHLALVQSMILGLAFWADHIYSSDLIAIYNCEFGLEASHKFWVGLTARYDNGYGRSPGKDCRPGLIAIYDFRNNLSANHNYMAGSYNNL